MNEAVDVVHQQLPCAGCAGGVEGAPDGLLLVELPAMVVVPTGSRQRQGRYGQNQCPSHRSASILCSAQPARCRTISSICVSREIRAWPGALQGAFHCTSGDSCPGIEFTMARATSGSAANFWSASTAESPTLTLLSRFTAWSRASSTSGSGCAIFSL